MTNANDLRAEARCTKRANRGHTGRDHPRFADRKCGSKWLGANDLERRLVWSVLPSGDVLVMGGFDGSRRNDVWKGCSIGRQWSSEDRLCVVCPAGTYNDVTVGGTCMDCPSGAEIPAACMDCPPGTTILDRLDHNLIGDNSAIGLNASLRATTVLSLTNQDVEVADSGSKLNRGPVNIVCSSFPDQLIDISSIPTRNGQLVYFPQSERVLYIGGYFCSGFSCSHVADVWNIHLNFSVVSSGNNFASEGYAYHVDINEDLYIMGGKRGQSVTPAIALYLVILGNHLRAVILHHGRPGVGWLLLSISMNAYCWQEEVAVLYTSMYNQMCGAGIAKAILVGSKHQVARGLVGSGYSQGL